MKGETLEQTAKRMEGEPNTALNGQACALAGKHRCGGPVVLAWGVWLCSVGGLLFSDSDHRDTPRRLREWIRVKGGTTP